MIGKILQLSYSSSFAKKMADIVAAQKRSLGQKIKHNVQNNMYKIQHEAKLRQRVTLESSVDNLEKQLTQEIASALKRSESKVLFYFQKTHEKLKQHEKYPFSQNQKNQYNNLVKLCEKARWEYMVHRQSCGFTLKNYEIVTYLYKLPPKL